MQRLPRFASLSTAIVLLAIALAASPPSLAITPAPTIAQATHRPPTGPVLLAQAAAVPITGAQDAVAKFNVSQQLYIQGNTLTPGQVNRLITTLNANPNVFVVVMDYSANVLADDQTLSRGIANSAAFEGVVNDVTGERQGVLLMVYFDSDQGRMIFMRSEELPDRLGVGEANFADENGNPKELLSLFIDAARNQGNDLPGALDVLINRINGIIRQQVANSIGQAQQTIEQAATALAGFPVTLGQFRRRFQVGGAVGNSNIAVWEVKLENARNALGNNSFAEAQKLAQTVVDQIHQQQEAMSRYGQAPEIAAQVQQTLEAGAIALNTIPDRNRTQQAAQFLAEGQAQFQQFQTQYQAGQIEFWNSLQAAQTSGQSLTTELEQVRQGMRQTQFQRLIILLVILSVLLGVAIALFMSARNARLNAKKVLRQAK